MTSLAIAVCFSSWQTRHDHATLSERYCSSVPGCSLRSSLCDSIKATSAFCYHAVISCHIDWVPTDVGPSLSPVRRRGTIYRNSCVILSTPPPCLHLYWRHFFSLSTSVYSALGAVSFCVDALSLCKLTFYLLTYLVKTCIGPPDVMNIQHVLTHADENQWGLIYI